MFNDVFDAFVEMLGDIRRSLQELYDELSELFEEVCKLPSSRQRGTRINTVVLPTQATFHFERYNAATMRFHEAATGD